MRNRDKLQPTGRVKITITDTRTGDIDVREGKNLVVTTGRECCALLVGSGNTDKIVETMDFGTDNTAANMSDTAITGAFNKGMDSITYPAANQVQFDCILETTENNGMTIEEVGLITADGTLFARYLTGTIVKSSFLRVAIAWTITF